MYGSYRRVGGCIHQRVGTVCRQGFRRNGQHLTGGGKDLLLREAHSLEGGQLRGGGGVLGLGDLEHVAPGIGGQRVAVSAHDRADHAGEGLLIGLAVEEAHAVVSGLGIEVVGTGAPADRHHAAHDGHAGHGLIVVGTGAVVVLVGRAVFAQHHRDALIDELLEMLKPPFVTLGYLILPNGCNEMWVKNFRILGEIVFFLYRSVIFLVINEVVILTKPKGKLHSHSSKRIEHSSLSALILRLPGYKRKLLGIPLLIYREIIVL